MAIALQALRGAPRRPASLLIHRRTGHLHHFSEKNGHSLPNTLPWTQHKATRLEDESQIRQVPQMISVLFSGFTCSGGAAEIHWTPEDQVDTDISNMVEQRSWHKIPLGRLALSRMARTVG